MTWHFDVSGTDLHIWTHTQDPASDPPHQTFTNENGWTWDDHPDAVLGVMHDEAQTAVQSGDVPRAIAIALDMAGEQIERAEQ